MKQTRVTTNTNEQHTIDKVTYEILPNEHNAINLYESEDFITLYLSVEESRALGRGKTIKLKIVRGLKIVIDGSKFTND